MKKQSRKAAIAAAALVLVLAVVLVCTGIWPGSRKGDIYLYGEYHGMECVQEKEFELWEQYYKEQGLRHLFIEYPYFDTELLNLWMQSDSDEILDLVYENWYGTMGGSEFTRNFLKKIKEFCPETVFHGTDVGHTYLRTGPLYLEYLEENGLKDSQQYALALENIEQGRYYYETEDNVYRENKMTENFMREYEALRGEAIMGIYGQAHVELDGMDYETGTVPCMGGQLREEYGEQVHSQNMTLLTEPMRTDTLTINGREYKASYFGRAYTAPIMTGCQYMRFWRLEDAYEDFQANSLDGYSWTEERFPMQIEEKQVFVIDYLQDDGTEERYYYRTDHASRSGELLAYEIRSEDAA